MQKQLLPLLCVFILLIFSCSEDEGPGQDNPGATSTTGAEISLCETNELEIKSDGQSCDVASGFGICDILKIEDTQFIDESAYEWIPDICGFDLDDNIRFRNGSNTTSWTVVERDHYVAKERVHGSCDGDWHDTAFICQENEVIRVSFVSSALGILDTLHLELRTKIISSQGGNPGAKQNVVGLWQDRAFTNVANFWINHYVGENYYQQTWQSYNETVILNGIVHRDVIKYEYGDHIHDDPHHRFYMKHGTGILAFEVEDTLWIRE